MHPFLAFASLTDRIRNFAAILYPIARECLPGEVVLLYVTIKLIFKLGAGVWMHVNLTFQPMGLTVRISPGTTVLEAALQSELFLRHVCGGNMICTTCRCKVLEGAESLSPIGKNERRLLANLCAPVDTRLACQARVQGDAVVEIPVPTLGV